MATIFNSKTARTVLAEQKNILSDAIPPMDQSVLAADRLYVPSDKMFRTRPHLIDGRSLDLIIHAIASIPGQNVDVLDRMREIIELSGPAAQAEKRKADEARKQSRHSQSTTNRTASRIIFKASLYNEDGSINWNNTADPDDNYAEQDIVDLADPTNFSESMAPDWTSRLKNLGIDPEKVIREIPDINILLPTDPESKNQLRSRMVDDMPSKKPCDHDDCTHEVTEMMKELKWVDPVVAGQRRCDQEKMVCSTCENLPMESKKSCTACGRRGTLSKKQMLSEPMTYDPDSVRADKSIVDMVTQGITSHGVSVDKRPDDYDNIVEGNPGEFDTDNNQIDYANFVHELSKNHKPLVEPGEEEAQKPEEPEEATSEELDPVESEKDNQFEQQPVTVAERSDHAKNCSYGCINGSLIGSSTSKAKQQIKAINNSPERVAAIEQAKNQVNTLKNKASRPGYLSRLVDAINYNFYRCPDLADEG